MSPPRASEMTPHFTHQLTTMKKAPELTPYQRFIETLMHIFIILVLGGICLKVLFF
jgi:hypothetical protein